MKLTKEGKLYPKKTQLLELERLLETSRQLYNHCLEIKIEAYRKNKKNISRFELSKQVKNYGDMPASLRQMVVYRLNNAYEQFFRRGGFPRFKKQGRYRSIPLRQYGVDYRIEGKYLIAWKKYGLNGIKIRGLQKLNKPSLARLVRRASGWYIQVIDEVEEAKPKKIIKKAVGIDFGLKHFVVDTDGNKVISPKYFKKTEKKLAIQHRQLSKKKKGGKKWEKAKKIVAKTYEKIANQRKDFLHKLSHKYASNYDLISVEDLNIKGMMKYKHLSKAITDVSWGMFTNMLVYKTKKLGGHLVKVNPRYTTQKCSQCGELIQKTLSIRTHICTRCGYVADRDENASRNILFLGLDKAIAEGLSVESPMKRETPQL